jgi:hypothetical protein
MIGRGQSAAKRAAVVPQEEQEEKSLSENGGGVLSPCAALAHNRENGIEEEGGDDESHLSNAYHKAVVRILHVKIRSQEGDQCHIELPADGQEEVGRSKGEGGTEQMVHRARMPMHGEVRESSRKDVREEEHEERTDAADESGEEEKIHIVAVPEPQEDHHPQEPGREQALADFGNEDVFQLVVDLEDRAQRPCQEREERGECG